MEPGQVSFHNDKEVRKIHIERRNNAIVNRLKKTKRAENPNLRAEREERDRLERINKKKSMKEEKEREKLEEKKKQELAEMRYEI